MRDGERETGESCAVLHWHAIAEYTQLIGMQPLILLLVRNELSRISCENNGYHTYFSKSLVKQSYNSSRMSS